MKGNLFTAAMLAGVLAIPATPVLAMNDFEEGEVLETSISIGNSFLSKNFPDRAFQNFLKSKGVKDNGEGAPKLIEDTTEMNLSGLGIENLKGIDQFRYLKKLTINNNRGLVALDLSGNSQLEELECKNGDLISIDFPSNLKKLDCQGNDLTDLNVSGLSSLLSLNCQKQKNGLISLTLPSSSSLQELNCSSNRLKSLDAANQSYLNKIDCSNNRLTSIKINGDYNLKILNCSQNNLTDLDLQGNSNLKDLNCSKNLLESLEVNSWSTFDKLDCSNNRLTALDLTGCTVKSFSGNNQQRPCLSDAGNVKVADLKIPNTDNVLNPSGAKEGDDQEVLTAINGSISYQYLTNGKDSNNKDILLPVTLVKKNSSSTPSAPSAPVEDHDGTPMHRLYNPNSGEHFYTASNNEAKELVKLGWTSEGIGWYASDSKGQPVYRLYNQNAGDHHYTLDLNEKNTLVELGWKYEGIGWYSENSKGEPVYRQYNPNATGAGSHNYTTNKAENDHLVNSGWKYEGIAWYGVK